MASLKGALLTVGVAVVALIAGTAVGLGVLPALSGSDDQSRNDQIVSSVERLEEVVLVGLGIEGIAEHSEDSEFFGIKVPGSKRTMFLQYSFKAKLGLNGEDVVIEPVGEDKLLITIPEFEFIGHSEAEFRLVTEDNGIMSFVTPEIDPVAMINEILDDDAKDSYVDSNQDVLISQTEAFYSGIVSSVDPELDVEFVFASGR